MDRPILIFGSRGMLGQSLMDAFPGAIGLDIDVIDITDSAQVENAITEFNPQVVINAAAFNDVDVCETDEGLAMAMRLNAAAPETIAKQCAQQGSIFVHFSTNYVFPGSEPAGYAEDDAPAPINRYGESKRAGEVTVREAMKDARYYIIRTAKLFGRPGTSAVAKKSFFEVMLALSETKKELQAVDDEVGNFTYTPDLAQFTKELIEKEYPAGIYHGVNEHPATWHEGARTLFDISGWSGTLTPVDASAFPRPAQRPQYGALCNTRGPKMRGYEEALREYMTKLQSTKRQSRSL